MFNFFQSLSDDEQALLSHVCMQHLDRTFAEHDIQKGSMRFWDRQQQRVDYEVEINGVPMTIEGFARLHPEFDAGWGADKRDKAPISRSTSMCLA